MDFQKRNLDPRIFFKRRSINAGAADKLSHGFSAERRKALFSLPVIVFLASLIISPLLFLLIVFGERAAYRLVSGISITGFLKRKTLEVAQKGESECAYRHPLDGTCLALPWGRKKIIAVSVDNMIDARPQSGLADARLVIEAPVEAGITRLLAFYGEGDEVPEIGPVRSARPYFIDFAKEYEAVLVHVGGSPEALKAIEKERYPDVDEMKGGAGFWRDGRRQAPHSTFVSAKNIFSKINFLSDVAPLPSVPDEAPEAAKPDSRVRIPAASSLYEVQWRYSKEDNAYERLLSGTAHKDSGGRAITAKNVVVLRMPVEIIDDIGRRSIGTLGSGEAVIFRNGETVIGTWRRDSLTERTRFFDSDGGEVGFAPGPMWIEIVSKTAKVEYN